MVLDGKGLGLEWRGDRYDGRGDGGDEGLVEGAEEVEGCDVVRWCYSADQSDKS
jgi:hypothetical protein